MESKLPTTPNKYFGRFIELLDQELAAEREEDELRKLTNSLSKREERGLAWSEVRLIWIRTGLGGKYLLKLQRISNPGTPHHLHLGHSVLLFNAEQFAAGNRDEMLTATIKASYEDDSKEFLELFVEDLDSEEGSYLPDWISYGSLGLEKTFRTKYFDNLRKNLTHLRSGKGSKELKKLCKLLIDPSEKPGFSLRSSPPRPQHLNERQWEAIQNIVNAKNLMVVHGPPGTGKTTTLIEAVMALLEKEQDQILVTAPSNAAVDLITEKLSKRGVNVLRLGNPLKIKGAAAECTLEKHLELHPDAHLLLELRKEYEKFRELGRNLRLADRRSKTPSFRHRANNLNSFNQFNRKDLRLLEKSHTKEILKNVQVVATTLYGSHDSKLKKQYSTVFIDEAGQAAEFTCWMPIRKAKRLVMMGDHQQLPPVIKAKTEDGLHELSKTLFEKVIERFQAGVMLDVQYRMNKEIMAIPSLCFYNDRLSAAEEVAYRKIDTDFSILFLDTSEVETAYEERFDSSHSYCNPYEVNVLMEKFSEILDKHSNTSLSVGVISPYKGQTRLLSEAIDRIPAHKKGGLDITVDSIDAFQGQERDIILISLVRNNVKGEFGFLSEYRRMNVAISRAKKKLIIVGSANTLLKGEERHLKQLNRKGDIRKNKVKFFKTMLDFIEANGSLIKLNKDHIENKLMN
jgi:predicted DNA helicase